MYSLIRADIDQRKKGAENAREASRKMQQEKKNACIATIVRITPSKIYHIHPTTLSSSLFDP